MSGPAFPLDLGQTAYPYLERPNSIIVSLVEKHVLAARPGARVLDVGCGAGTNGQTIKRTWPQVSYLGIEPNARAAALAREVLDEVFHGTIDDWLAGAPAQPCDAVILSDFLEHTADPVGLLRRLTAHPSTRHAVLVISVPNYAVWYNRLNTLLGHFRYEWSGLYDRTHLRFFTRQSLGELLRYCGLHVAEERCTPSLVQSAAPILRRFFAADLARQQHRALADSAVFRTYRRFVEPLEQGACALWPELLGFQLVTVSRVENR